MSLPVLCALCAVGLSASTQEVTVHDGAPPAALNGAGKVDVTLRTNLPELHGQVKYAMTARQVVISWKAVHAGQMTVLDRQVETTSYWPTEIAPFGPGRLLVAGKVPLRNTTVIEIWTFADFDALPAPEEDHQTGRWERPSIHQRVTRTPVYDAAVVGRDMVRVLFHDQGDGTILCQFHDSRDVWSIDPTDGALTRRMAAAADPADPPSVRLVPELAQGYTDRRSAEHQRYGYVYTLGYPPNGSDEPSLYWFDVDKDGLIDEVQHVDAERWIALGLADPTQYVQSFY